MVKSKIDRKGMRSSDGFTLVEIIFVFAIAGLIMGIVFVALANAGRNRRDAQRQTDAARLLSGFEEYAANNHGTYPTSWAAFGALPSQFNDPSTGNPYDTSSYAIVNPGDIGDIDALPACDASNIGRITVAIKLRQVIVRMCLEAGFHDIRNFQ